MKNKKSKRNWGNIIVMSALALLVISLTVISLTVKFIPNEPHFKITKEECWNITGEIGFDNFKRTGFGANENILNYKIKRYGIYQIDDLFCVNYLKQQGHKDFILDSCEYYEEGAGLEIIGRKLINEGSYFSYGEKIFYSIYPEKIVEIFPEEFTFNEERVYLKDGKIINDNIFYYLVVDVIKNQTICEEVEVDKIEIKELIGIFEHENDCWEKGDYSAELIYNEKCISSNLSECFINCFNYIKISKQDLTTAWLDENCECTERNCEYIFNASKKEKFKVEDAEKFIAKTYEGFIWFTVDKRGNEIAEFYHGNVELIEECNPCQKYKCGYYIVEVEG